MSTRSEPQLIVRRRTLLEWLAARNGIAHTSDARVAGFSIHEIGDVVASAGVTRVRRSWLVAPGCDPRRAAAASVGGRVTCVSGAALLGVWTPAYPETHVSVAGTSSRLSPEGLKVHWGVGPAPVARNANEDPVINMLFQVARCLPRVEALAIWESTIRKRFAAPAVLAQVAWRTPNAVALASVASSLSDSGLETHLIHGLRREGIVVKQQVWIDGRPVDGLIGDSLVLQADGFEFHSSPADRRRDMEADARLALRGYVVLRFDFHQILFEWDYVVETVRAAIAQGAHRRPVLQNR